MRQCCVCLQQTHQESDCICKEGVLCKLCRSELEERGFQCCPVCRRPRLKLQPPPVQIVIMDRGERGVRQRRRRSRDIQIVQVICTLFVLETVSLSLGYLMCILISDPETLNFFTVILVGNAGLVSTYCFIACLASLQNEMHRWRRIASEEQ